ncbi:MAG TPA: hypothetical protein VI895_08850 [Bdellovibrionota bacterium]|nr:hypothetical protein [Bdellovibrionota bacterium]
MPNSVADHESAWNQFGRSVSQESFFAGRHGGSGLDASNVTAAECRAALSGVTRSDRVPEKELSWLTTYRGWKIIIRQRFA